GEFPSAAITDRRHMSQFVEGSEDVPGVDIGLDPVRILLYDECFKSLPYLLRWFTIQPFYQNHIFFFQFISAPGVVVARDDKSVSSIRFRFGFVSRLRLSREIDIDSVEIVIQLIFSW